MVVALEQDHLGANLRGSDRGCSAGRSASDHEHVASVLNWDFARAFGMGT